SMSARFHEPSNRVDRLCSHPYHAVARTYHSKVVLGLAVAMLDRSQQVRQSESEACERRGVETVVLPAVCRQRSPGVRRIGHDHVDTKLLERLTDPCRMGPRLANHASPRRELREALHESLELRRHAPVVANLPVALQRDHVAVAVTEVEPDGHE